MNLSLTSASESALYERLKGYDVIVRGSFARQENFFDDIDCVFLSDNFSSVPSDLPLSHTGRDIHYSLVSEYEFRERYLNSPRIWDAILEGRATSERAAGFLQDARRYIHNHMLEFALYLSLEEELMQRYSYEMFSGRYYWQKSLPGGLRTVWRCSWLLKISDPRLAHYRSSLSTIKAAYKLDLISTSQYTACINVLTAKQSQIRYNPDTAIVINGLSQHLREKIFVKYAQRQPLKARYLRTALSTRNTEEDLSPVVNYAEHASKVDRWITFMVLASNTQLSRSAAKKLWRYVHCNKTYGIIARHLIANHQLPLQVIKESNYQDVHLDFYIAQRSR